MFLNIDRYDKDKTAVKDDSGYSLTYGDVFDAIRAFEVLCLPRCVVFCMCENCAGSLIGYLAFENNGQVPLLLGAKLDVSLRNELAEKYAPCYYWLPRRKADEINGTQLYEAFGYVLVRTGNEPYPLNDKLSLLLSTSGSTGSPKLVRHKYGNLEANARNAAEAFSFSADDVGVCSLPMNYTMGLNVINSYLAVGATVLMLKAELTDPDFWEAVKLNGGTGFCGVPFSYEVLRRIGFEDMELPKLTTLSQGGGRMTDRQFRWIAEYAVKSGKRFFATFGTSETSARMSYLAPGLALERVGSIGKAIPNGELFLADASIDENGDAVGELGYRGENVTMGYAVCREDLTKGDELCGEYLTGDIARRDKDGFYYIVGRKGRFLKLFGLRVSLDETERILKAGFPEADFACAGDDSRMCVFVTDEAIKNDIIPFLGRKLNIHGTAFRVSVIDAIPRNEYGKVRFSELPKR